MFSLSATSELGVADPISESKILTGSAVPSENALVNQLINADIHSNCQASRRAEPGSGPKSTVVCSQWQNLFC